MNGRALWIDRAWGESRGVVTLDGRPEALLIDRDDDPTPRLGALYRGRVTGLSRRMRAAWIDIGAPRPAFLNQAPDSLTEGASVAAVVTAEPQNGKGAVLRFEDVRPGEPGLLEQGPSLEERLRAYEPSAAISGGAEARLVADEAEAAASARSAVFSGGMTLTIEPTRALVAVDVDLSDEGALALKNALAANRRAIREAARLLRLKALAGLIVIDLIGFPGGHPSLLEEARLAFAPDGAGVRIGRVSPFGALELAVPRTRRPLHELLLDPRGGPSLRALAQATLRRIEAERDRGGGLMQVRCAPALARLLGDYAPLFGPRFRIVETLGLGPEQTDISPL